MPQNSEEPFVHEMDMQVVVCRRIVEKSNNIILLESVI